MLLFIARSISPSFSLAIKLCWPVRKVEKPWRVFDFVVQRTLSKVDTCSERGKCCRAERSVRTVRAARTGCNCTKTFERFALFLRSWN